VRHKRRAAIAIAVACTAAVLSVEFVLRSWARDTVLDPQQIISELDVIVPGLAFVGVGLVAWSLRPANRVGPLMMGVGFAYLISADWGFLPRPFGPLYAILGNLPWAVLVHMLLAFPGGRLVSRLERVVVWALYASALLAGAASAGFALGGLSGRWGWVAGAGLTGFGGCLLLGCALVIRRWLLGTAATRRSMSPVFWSLAPTIAAFALPYLIPLVGPLADSAASGRLIALYLASPLLLAAAPVGFLVGLLRTQLDMSAVGDLVVELSGGLLPERLQPELARVLHDPSLEVVYWLPALRRFANLEGRPVSAPVADLKSAVSVLGDPANPVAALVYDASLRRDPQVVDAAAAAVRMALENGRLQAELRAQLREVQQSRARLVDAADNERRSVERDLHDGAQQQLVSLMLSMQLARTEAQERSEPETVLMLDGNIETLKQALGELRELARGIHPTILMEAGLIPAIRSLAERCSIHVEIGGDVGRLERRSEVALYFVAAEAMTNAVKHSQGRKIRIDFGRHDGFATIDILDDGIGGAKMSRGSGLVGLSDRMAAVGGRLEVESFPGHGTKLHAEVPCG
jgi:signal transduction histidine kinase